MTILPIVLFAIVGEPVALLKIAGAVEAAHIPIVAILTVYLNRTRLPRELRPSIVATSAAVVAACFFAAFAVYYVVTL